MLTTIVLDLLHNDIAIKAACIAIIVCLGWSILKLMDWISDREIRAIKASTAKGIERIEAPHFKEKIDSYNRIRVSLANVSASEAIIDIRSALSDIYHTENDENDDDDDDQIRRHSMESSSDQYLAYWHDRSENPAGLVDQLKF